VGQAKRRGDYATRKSEGEVKAAQAEAERQERLRAEREQLRSTARGRKAQKLGAMMLTLGEWR
jgi:hypothetical protein